MHQCIAVTAAAATSFSRLGMASTTRRLASVDMGINRTDPGVNHGTASQAAVAQLCVSIFASANVQARLRWWWPDGQPRSGFPNETSYSDPQQRWAGARGAGWRCDLL
jgi:hypothetical protein